MKNMFVRSIQNWIDLFVVGQFTRYEGVTDRYIIGRLRRIRLGYSIRRLWRIWSCRKERVVFHEVIFYPYGYIRLYRTPLIKCDLGGVR